MKKKFEFTPEEVFKPKKGDIITRNDEENGSEFYVSETSMSRAWIARLENPFDVIELHPEEYSDYRKISKIKTR